tara:strand:- start:1732 stop:4047 length:2316 start_codon:yes stop_codon:yes gene_type:complete
MKFKTKAQNLINLKLKNASIPKVYYFRVKDYKKDKKTFLNNIKKRFKKKIAIRSSSSREDGINNSNAGMFKSFLNIIPNNSKMLSFYINQVILSYKKKGGKNDEILIQEMVDDVSISGVATSCDKDTFSPYYHINFSKNKDTSLVTSGKDGSKSFVFFKFSKIKPKSLFLKKIINLLSELEKKFKNNAIDIEFIVDQKQKLYLVQVRPLVRKSKTKKIDYVNQLKKLEKKINKLQLPHHDLLGKKTAFGVMPDWNPAEIIGIKPKPLALSLYQELITDHIWSQQRKNYGYRNVGSNHLMANFFGTPFVDIRVDFNSWIPASLDKKISIKLVNFYIEKFIKNKNLHDKVEFEILFTCYTPSSSKRINSILKKNFSKSEIKFILTALKKINLISTRNFESEQNKIEYLKKRQRAIKNSKMYYIDKIYWLIEDCKRYGTLPFAGLARNGFVATDILNSLIKENIVSQKKIDSFLMEINTITSEISKDWINLTKKKFLSKHGHLRPNTYEITSLNYHDGYNLYFSKKDKKKQIFNLKKDNVIFSSKEKMKINKFLFNSKLNLNFNQFINYIKNSIKMREYSKHVFTKSIDYLFYNIKILCKRLNISIKDASYLKINQITDLYYNLSNHNIGETFKKEIHQNKLQYELNSYIKLPETISSIKDIYFYNESQNKINFIGNKSVYSDIIYLKDKVLKVEKLKNKIVCIESADPGYDFIFLANISGLITKYGGVNSHMSVRCSELKIPAAIGVGENKFNQIIKNKKIELNCETQKIECL